MHDADTAQQSLSERIEVAMRAYQEADRDAAEEFVRLVHPILSRFLLALPNTSPNLDDLLQECWLRIHRARHSYRPGEPVLPWVFSIARHARVDYYRRTARGSARESGIEQAAETLVHDPRQRLDAALDSRVLVDLLRRLPDSQREILFMLKVSGMSTEEAARATGSTASAVKQKAWRAYENLRRHFRKQDGAKEGERQDAVRRY
ncbi:MAG: RNA polymerase sigma factor [Bryobacteraceae bacterium]